MKKVLFLLLVIICLGNLRAQFSIGVGPSSFLGVGTDPFGERFVTRYGINVFYEQPRNEVNTFYLRGLLTVPVSRFDSVNVSKKPDQLGTPGPSIKTISLKRRTTMFSVDGGTRTYFLNTFEVGTAFYGSLHLRGIIASYGEEYGEFDETIYEPSNPPFDKEYALLMGFGGNLGVKYQLPYRGSVTFDVVLDLIRGLYDPAFILGNDISPLSFSFNLAYRFDWY